MHSTHLANKLMLGVPISFITVCFRNVEVHTLALNWNQVMLVESGMEIRHPGGQHLSGTWHEAHGGVVVKWW